MFHKISRCIFSPREAFKIILGWFSSSSPSSKDECDEVSEAPIPMDTLGDNDPAPKEKKVPLYSSLNTDARTCQDVITELGYGEHQVQFYPLSFPLYISVASTPGSIGGEI